MAKSLIPAKYWGFGSWLNLLGGVLGFAGVVFVSFRLSEYLAELQEFTIGAPLLVMIVVLSAVYGISNLLLAYGWTKLFEIHQLRCDTPTMLRIYSVSILGKYVPGNVFQFVSRHALGLSAGLKSSVMLKVAFLELVFLAVGGVVLASLAVGYLVPNLSGIYSGSGFAILLIGVCSFLEFKFGRAALLAFVSYFFFLVISGLCFIFVCELLVSDGLPIVSLLYIIGAYVLAWLLGLVTPGAPAGLGVREATLIMLLDQTAPASVILFAVLISRIVTVSGDFLFYAFGHLLGPVALKPANSK